MKYYDELYTLDEAERIVHRHDLIKQNWKRRIIAYLIKQKLFGLLLILTGFIIPIITGGEGSVSLILVPLGILLMVKNEKIINFRI